MNKSNFLTLHLTKILQHCSLLSNFTSPIENKLGRGYTAADLLIVHVPELKTWDYEGRGADDERCFIGFQDENQSSYSIVENPTIFSRTNWKENTMNVKSVRDSNMKVLIKIRIQLRKNLWMVEQWRN